MCKSIISPVLLAVAVSASALNPSVDAFPGLDKYCYPGNTPRSVKALVYTSDSRNLLNISEDGKSIVKTDVVRGTSSETIFDVNNTREVTIKSIDGFKMSDDGRKMLVWTDSKPIYRRSFTAKYYIYDFHSRILMPLSDKFERQQAPVMSPDGRMCAFMAEDNNIYVKKIDYNTEVAVTTDGAVNKVINGVPDWTYEEEFTTTCSMCWAPDNLTLSFLKYNETEVPMFNFPIYEGTCDADRQYALYPGTFSYKYPVAGQNNSVVTLHSYDVETRKVKNITLPDSRIEYIPRIAYASAPEQLIVTTLNRDQNRMEVYCVNPKSTVAKSVLVEDSKAWIAPETYENMTLLPGSLIVMSGRSGYTHLYQYSYAGAMMRQLTSGNYDVTAYYGTDAAGNHYYQSTVSGPVNRVVSQVDAKGRVKKLSPEKGVASAQFAPDCSMMLLQYSNSATAPVYTLQTPAGGNKRVLEDNKSYQAAYAGMSVKEFFKMPADGDTPELNGYMVKPRDFSPSKTYPVIMYQYSGPGSQEVLDRWEAGWQSYFADQGYIVMCVDGRGTGGRGRAFMDAVYKDLGKYETADQLAAARYAATLPYVDPSRIGIYGWSYGGYETLMAVTASGNTYRAGVAVAPVTDWRYYDTVYAERYMTTPAMNEDGYDDSSVLGRVNNLKCRLLVMSGTADDNVHLFNTMQFVSHLQSAGRYCDMFLFPNMNHSINGCDARRVVMARMLDYFNQNLKD